MARKPYLALLLACCAGPAVADSFDDFSFPELDSAAEKRSLLFDSPAAESSPSDAAPAPRDLPPVSGTAGVPRGRSVAAQSEGQSADEALAAPGSQLPADLQPAPYAFVPQPGYFAPAGPSNPSPLLAYMQCSPDTCGDVWAGFAEQHRRDMARYCHEHGGCRPHSRCTLHAEPCVIAPHHRHAPINRYAPAAPCASCDTK